MPAEEATVLIGRRSVEAGNRIDDLRHTDYRMVIGAKGDFGDGWSYDMSAQYGVSIYADNQLNYFSGNKFQNALQVVDVGGVPTCESVINNSDPSCVPAQIFIAPTLNATRSAAISSPLFANNDAVLNYVNANGEAIGQTNEELITGNVTGDLGGWGIQAPSAKSPVAVSFGGEYREEGINYQPDGELRTGDLMGIGGQRAPAMPTLTRLLRVAGLVVGLGVAAGLGIPGAALAEDADAFYKEGIAYKQQGKIDEAIKAFEEAVAEQPEARHGVGVAGQPVQAEEGPPEVDRRIRARGRRSSRRTRCSGSTSARAYANNDQLDDALDALHDRVQARPQGSPRSRASSARSSARRATTPARSRDLEIAVKLEARRARLVAQPRRRVSLRQARRRRDQGVRDRRSSSRRTRRAITSISASCIAARQDPDKAIPEYEKATSLDPGNADGWFDLGYMYKQNHENDKAIDAFNHYLELNKGKDAGRPEAIEEEMGGIGGEGFDHEDPAEKGQVSRSRHRGTVGG